MKKIKIKDASLLIAGSCTFLCGILLVLNAYNIFTVDFDWIELILISICGVAMSGAGVTLFLMGIENPDGVV